jgi:hypothetical protein
MDVLNNLTPQQWARVRLLFEQALAQPAADREAYVNGSDELPAVKKEVLSLLAHATGGAGAATGFMVQPVQFGQPGAGPETAERPLHSVADELFGPAGLEPGAAGPGAGPDDAALADPQRLGQRLGAWEIVAPLGAGGMGEVFRARRADGSFEGEAAIKVLKRGMDSKAVLQRFALERRVLARLHHPHIAHLLDAGVTPDGLPYFVMELVHGMSIDLACAGRSLPARIGLVLQLTDAVAYAHRNLLVHRDLKPANVLVDEQGQVKLLDFGIAKALDPLESRPGTLPGQEPELDITAVVERPFTPLYASPEQVRGEPLGTATDVYSLGVLLYVLLTGQRPYGRDARTPLDAARAVLEEEPTRPSALPPMEVTEVPDAPALPTDGVRLDADLDNVLLKALQKDPALRYASVDALAADLRAYLEGRPVSARAPGWAYLAGKFVRRHKLPVALAAMAVLALAGGLGATAWQAREARLARDEARMRLADTRAVLRDLVFRFGDGVALLPGGMKLQRDLLQDTLKTLERSAAARAGAAVDPGLLADQAMLHARLAELMGNDGGASLDQPGGAAAHAEQAIALGRQAGAAQFSDWRLANWLSRAYVVRAQLQRGQGQVAQALATLDESQQPLNAALAATTDEEGRLWLQGAQGSALITSAQLLFAAGSPSLNRPEEAGQRYQQATRLYQQMLSQPAVLARMDAKARPEEPKAAHYVMHQLSTILEAEALIALRRDDLAGARTSAQAAVARQRELLQADDKTVSWRDGWMARNNTLALTLLRQGDHAGALLAAQRAWDAARALAASEGKDSRWAAQAPAVLALQYGRALALNGRAAEALAVGENALPTLAAAAQQPTNTLAQRRAAQMHLQLSQTLQALNRAAEAQPHAQQAVQALRKLAGSTPKEQVAWREVHVLLAEALAWSAQLQAGAPAQAEALRAEARRAYEVAHAAGPLKADRAEAWRQLGGKP